MIIKEIKIVTPQHISLWEQNLGELWSTYGKATKFAQYNDDGDINAEFAVYYDESDGVKGNFVSGWSARHNLDSVIHVIKYLANLLGEIYIKTEKRQVKIIGYKLGKLVKNTGRFSYFIIRGE